MRFITVPPPISIDGSTAVSLPVLVIATLLNDKTFLRGREAMKQADKIEGLFAAAGVGDVVPVEDADWLLLKQAADKPSSEYLPVARKLLPFLDAICDAPTTKPE